MCLTTMFCNIDDFCMEFEPYFNRFLIESKSRRRIRKRRLSLSEIMTILIMFHRSHYRDFKAYYNNHVSPLLLSEFPRLVSYNRFVEYIPSTLIPMIAYLNTTRCGSPTGISFIDSTPIRVCHNRRIHSHKVFSQIAQRGKCSMGWFYGFKLHLIVNDRGELLSAVLTPGQVDDRDPTTMATLTRNVWGKLFGDRGYISKKLFENLLQKGVQLITKIRKNMKNKLMSITDKILWRKRAIIETINDQLKNICQIEHTRHRSPINFMVNLVAGLVAYTFLDKKPSLRFENEKCVKAIAW